MRKGSLAAVLAAVLAATSAAAQSEGQPQPDPGARPSEGAPEAARAAQPEAARADVAIREDQLLIYSVDRRPERTFDTARDVTVVTGEELRRKNARTLPEALMGEPGVFMQQTDYGAGSPIIRGLIGKQILLLVDGVKLNNATYRFGPIQYLATIDLASVDRVEIVKGVGSVLGSEALGGIINVITKKGPPDRRGGPGGALGSRWASADGSVIATAQAYESSQTTRAVAGGTFRSTGDVTAGDGLDQPHTGYDERAAFARLEWFATDEISIAASYQGLQQDDVPRTDRYASGSALEYLYTPQRMQLGTLSLSDQTSRPFADRVQATVYWNRQDEAVDEIQTASATTRREYRDSDTMAGATVEATLAIGRAHQLVYGLDYSHDWISSERNDVNLTTSVSTPKQSRYADGSRYDVAAAYAQDRIDLVKWLTVTIGGRVSYFAAGGTLSTREGDVALGYDTTALTGTLNASFHVTPKVNVVASVTPGFRAPTIDDISIWDERSNGVEVPNTAAKPERIIDYEAGVKYADGRASAAAFGYYSSLTDLLVRTNGTFRGLTWVDLNDNGTQDANETVFQKMNVGKAVIYGAGAQARYRVLPSLAAFGNVTWTRGNNEYTSPSQPLDRIPPIYGAIGATWTPKARFSPWAEVAVLFAGAQTRLSPADMADTRIGPDGTDGWQDLSIRAGAAFGRWVRVSAAAENLLDQQYKYHGSGVYRPGRQVVLGAEVRY